jgi:hypothetical protein
MEEGCTVQYLRTVHNLMERAIYIENASTSVTFQWWTKKERESIQNEFLC